MSIIFPKPLPEIIIVTEPDETTFTMLEKVTLQNAWRVIKRRFRRHAKDIFLDFFTDNETVLERFRGNNGKFHMESLHLHPQSVLKIYGRLIEDGLENVATINMIMTEVVDWHRKYGIPKEEIALLTTAVKVHLQAVLKDVSSPTLVLALDKICDGINLYHEEDL